MQYQISTVSKIKVPVSYNITTDKKLNIEFHNYINSIRGT